MIPNRDYYTDKTGKLTDDPKQYARQIAVKGCFLDPRVASRFGIGDTLVSVDEPAAQRRLTERSKASVMIDRIEDKEEETPKPQEPAEAAEPKAAAKKPAAKKEKKK